MTFPLAASHCFLIVTPAKAGVQGSERAIAILDPGFRRDDEWKVEGDFYALAFCSQAPESFC